MRVLIMSAPDITMSTLTVCRSIAEALLDKSHPVAIVCTPTTRRWFGLRNVTLFNHPEPTYDELLFDVISIQNLADFAKIAGFSAPAFIAQSVQAEIEAIRTFQPDIVYSDFCLTAPISTKACGLPLASSAAWTDHPAFESPLFKPPKNPEKSVEPFNAHLLALGLEPIRSVEELSFWRSDIKIVLGIPEFEPLMRDVPGTFYVGPLVSKSLEKQNIPEWLEELDSNSFVIFVYLSVGDVVPDQIIDVMPKAFDDTEFSVVVSFGHHPDVVAVPEPTSNVRFEPFVPGAAMMRKSDVLISHGGRNTALNAMLHHVPNMVFPGLSYERDFNARTIESLGAGVRLELSQFTPKVLRQTARKLVRQGLSEQARKIAASMSALGGAPQVVSILEHALKQ